MLRSKNWSGDQFRLTLVLYQCDIAKFSWSVRIQGKARLVANGRRPLQEAQRSHGCGQANPLGAPVVFRSGVTYMDVGQGREQDAEALPCLTRTGPLPAHCVLLRNTTGTLNLAISH